MPAAINIIGSNGASIPSGITIKAINPVRSGPIIAKMSEAIIRNNIIWSGILIRKIVALNSSPRSLKPAITIISINRNEMMSIACSFIGIS